MTEFSLNGISDTEADFARFSIGRDRSFVALISFEITSRKDFAGGAEFGDVGSYEQIDGIAHYAVDPDHERNQHIVDLEHCPRDEQGRVHFSGDLMLLVPKNPGQADRKLFLELPNRGRRLFPRWVNRSTVDPSTTVEVQPGDGFLLRHGYVVASVGWQWDVYRSDVLMGLEPPVAQGISGTTIVRFQPNSITNHKLLADRAHKPMPAADTSDPNAVLTVRDSELGEARVIQRDQWQFAREENGQPVADPEYMYLASGFEPGKVYEVTYHTEYAPVAGAGLLALRDAGSFLRFSNADDNPCAGTIDHAYAFGISQTGRMLRHFVYLGMNLDEDNRQVYDGLLPHVAGARRGEFNHRFAQPSVQNTPGFGHLFPHADEPHTHPDTGKVAGLLDRQRELGGMPKIFWTNSSAEYWRGDCAFLHIDMEGKTDLESAPETRIYSFASTQHGPGSLPLTDTTADTGVRGRHPYNAHDYTPLLRAAIVHLHRWAAEGIEPPASYHPTLKDRNVSTEEEIIEKFPNVPNLFRPDTNFLRKFPRVDMGPDASSGIGRFPSELGNTFPALVYDIDGNGNEDAPVRLPDLDYPVATYTPWNPRHPETGHPEQIIPMNGSTFFFSRTEAERVELNDPRPSIEERYASRDEYLQKIREAAEYLVKRGYILDEDVEACLADAAERYDEAMKTGPLNSEATGA